MTYIEYFKGKDIIVSTTARKLKNMLNAYKLDPTSFKESFKNLEVKRNGEEITSTLFYTFLCDNESTIKQFDNVSSIFDIVVHAIEDVIKFKEDAKISIKKEKVNNSLNVPEYTQNKKTITYSDVNIFETVLNCKPNEHDRKLYSNFLLVGDKIAYSYKDFMSLIFVDEKSGSLKFGIDDYSKDDSLYANLCYDLAPQYENYMNILQSKLASLDGEALRESIEEGNCGIIEDIFLKDVPSSFRHIVKIKAVYQSFNGTMILDKFIAKPLKNYGDMNSLEFTEFLEFLRKHFKKMTAGCLYSQDKYYTWSNDLSVKSTNIWLLPTNDEIMKSTMPEPWKKFWDNKASDRLLQRIYFYLGAMQDAHNYAQQALVISDKGQTGKSTLWDLLKTILPKSATCSVDCYVFDKNDRFGFSAANAFDAHLFTINEFDGYCITSSKGKAVTGGDTLSCEIKNSSSNYNWNTKGIKWIIPSNNGCALKTHANRRRVIPVSLNNTTTLTNRLSQKDLDELVSTGKEFLNYCYKVYLTCPFKTCNGEYIVMCPEHEDEFLKNGTIKVNEEQRLIKAFSNDEEISDYFFVGDFEESDMTMDFDEVTGAILEEDPTSFVSAKDLMKKIEEYIINNPSIAESFGTKVLKLGAKPSCEIHKLSPAWKTYKKYLKNHGFDDKVKNKQKVITGVKFKGWSAPFEPGAPEDNEFYDKLKDISANDIMSKLGEPVEDFK